MAPESAPTGIPDRNEWIWKVPELFGKERPRFHSSDVIHRADGRQALQIVEEDAFRISYKLYDIAEGKYLLAEEQQTSVDCFMRLLKTGTLNG